MAGSSEFTGVDFYDMDALLSEEERAVRDTVRSWVDDQLMPVIGECYLEGRFPEQFIPGMAELGPFGPNPPEEYGCRGLKNLAHRPITPEAGRGGTSVRASAPVPGHPGW